MIKKEYSAGAVKHSFWFMEFRKVVSLRVEGKNWDEIKQLNENENIFGAPTPLRANQIWNTVSGRVKGLDESFYPVFQSCDVAAQKLFALVAVMAYDTLFAEFIYEVVREKMIIGTRELSDSDIRIFFKNKQEQDDKVAKWTEATTKRLGACYKTMLFEAGMTDKAKDTRKILKPILDPVMERWLLDHDMEYCVKALTGVR
jgi:hypothetical protein